MAGGRSLPVYLTGTVTVADVSGTWTVAGSGTNFIAPDGVPNYTLLAGDMFVIPNVGFGTVASVASASSFTLDLWSGGAVTTASAYKIYRYEGLPTSAVVALVNQLLTMFTDANPQSSLTVDTGAVRFKFDDDGAGDVRLRVRSSTAAGGDAAYVVALLINAATGAVAYSGRPAPQTLTVTATDTLSPLAAPWPSGWAAALVVEGVMYFTLSSAFSVSGTSVIWSPAAAGTTANPVHLSPGMDVVLISL